MLKMNLDPPAHLSHSAQQIWREIVASVADTPRLLKPRHRIGLEGLCLLVEIMRRGGIGERVGLGSRELGTFVTLVGQFGLTPKTEQALLQRARRSNAKKRGSQLLARQGKGNSAPFPVD